MEKEIAYKDQILQFYPKNSFCVLWKGQVVNIHFDDITHISKYGPDSVVYTTHGKYQICLGLQELLNDLPVNSFFQTSRSHIVALKAITGIVQTKLKVGRYQIYLTHSCKVQMIARLGEIFNREYAYLL